MIDDLFQTLNPIDRQRLIALLTDRARPWTVVVVTHDPVLLAAVVAKPDPKWGETPCAFIELKPDAKPTEHELIEFCRAHLAHFKVPRRVVFGPLPKTSTGKIQKFVLRDQAKSASAIDT